jgi:hypothetical protein
MTNPSSLGLTRRAIARRGAVAWHRCRTLKLPNEARLARAISGMSGLAFRFEAKFPPEKPESSAEGPESSQKTQRLDGRVSAVRTDSAKKQNQQIKANLLK